MLTPSAYKRRQTKRRQTQRYATALLLLSVTALVLLLTGCAHNSPAPPTICPQLPATPPELTPQPSEPYSVSVHKLLSDWQARLTATPLMQPDAGSE